MSQCPACEARNGEVFFAGPAVLRQEIRPQAIDEHPECRLIGSRLERGGLFLFHGKARDVLRKHRELRMMHRSVGEKWREPARHAAEDLPQPAARVPAGHRRRHIARPFLEIAAKHLWRDKTTAEERAQSARSRRSPNCANTERHIVVVFRHGAADAKAPGRATR